MSGYILGLTSCYSALGKYLETFKIGVKKQFYGQLAAVKNVKLGAKGIKQ
jgi:hypothetical protein